MRFINRRHLLLAFVISLTGFTASCTTTRLERDASYNFHHGHYRRAYEELEVMAHRGYPSAQYAVAYMLYYGMGVAKDVDVARAWFRKAAQKDYAPARVALQLIEQDRNYPSMPTRANRREFMAEQKAKERMYNHTSDLGWLREQAPNRYAVDIRADQLGDEIRKSLTTSFADKPIVAYNKIQDGKRELHLVLGSYDNPTDANAVLAKIDKTIKPRAHVMQIASIQNVMLP